MTRFAHLRELPQNVEMKIERLINIYFFHFIAARFSLRRSKMPTCQGVLIKRVISSYWHNKKIRKDPITNHYLSTNKTNVR